MGIKYLTYRCTVASLAFINDLGSHVLQCSSECASGGAEASEPLRSTEVGYLHYPTIRVYKHVVAFYVAMDDFLVVKVLETWGKF
jgi:hypothetical protein